MKRAESYGPLRRRWIDGICAVIVTLFVELGITAGTTRECMPNLDWSIMVGQVEFVSLLAAPVLVLIMLAAFLIAALLPPPPIRLSVLALVIVGCAFAVAAGAAWHDVREWITLFAVLAAPVAIGLGYARFNWMRRFGIPIGLAAAASLGLTIFASLPYGQANCSI